MYKLPSLVLALCALLLAAACSPRVTTARPNQADLSEYETFAFLPNANVPMADEASSEQMTEAVVTEINENMRDQGYRLDRDNPDLLVLASVKTDIETETTTDPVYGGYAGYGTPGYGTAGVSPYYDSYYYSGYSTYDPIVGYDTDTYRYKEGTLVINVVDRETRETVWKGVSSEAITGSTSSELPGLVEAIFSEYPTTDGTAMAY